MQGTSIVTINNSMTVTSVSFKWLDILEKEFDTAFVSLDLLLNDAEEIELMNTARKKLATLAACFSQLSHKALTVFQVNAKTEAELINMKSDMIEIKTKNEVLEEQVNSLLQENVLKPNELSRPNSKHSPSHISRSDMDKTIISLENWKKLLQGENDSLRHTIVGLQAELTGARLAVKYLDKELAGRVQQIQLLNCDMPVDTKNNLWNQLEAEVSLQKYKTVLKMVRHGRNHNSPPNDILEHYRTIHLHREPHKSLGISVAGGIEHGLPIMISELDPIYHKKGLYIGDAIIAANGVDLTKMTHKEAVKILCDQLGGVTLTVKSISSDEIDNSDNPHLGYSFFDECDPTTYRNVTSKQENTQTPKSRNLPKCNTARVTKSKETEINEPSSINTLHKIFRSSSLELKNKKNECENSISDNRGCSLHGNTKSNYTNSQKGSVSSRGESIRIAHIGNDPCDIGTPV